MKLLRRYLINLLVALDETVNTLFLGSPHETISARLGRNYPGSLLYRVVDHLFFWQFDHCKEASINEPSCYEKGAIEK